MEKDIGKIPKNDFTDIMVRLDDFAGKAGITIREFSNSERYTGFTKSGTKIPIDNLEEFKTMLNAITQADIDEVKKAAEASAGATASGTGSAGGQASLPEEKEKPADTGDAGVSDY
tara:strand:- start:20 stop:367 length:348 start_codon:yes stop_codon:yes gene_type:complete